MNRYFRIFLATLLAESEPIEREDLRDKLFTAGLGDTPAFAGLLHEQHFSIPYAK